MASPDLNLLFVLQALLEEGSVSGAARRLRLSPSAMSHALARARKATGDPLFVRAGRGVAPTPRAIDLRGQVATVLESAVSVLGSARHADLRVITRAFTLRVSDGFVENFGAALLERAARDAPGIRLRFVQKTDRESAPLRDGSVDLETGVVSETTAPDLRMRALFKDRFVGVVRRGHPLEKAKVTRASYASAGHVLVSRRNLDKGLVDAALERHGLHRDIVATVGGFASALALARTTNLVATVPDVHTHGIRSGMHAFELPFALSPITVCMVWHPRMDADPAHRWLRDSVARVCRIMER